MATMTFTGISGVTYGFENVPLNSPIPNVSGVYSILGGDNRNTVLYVGETGEMGRRLANHEKWPHINKYRPASICYYQCPENTRKQVEEDIIRYYTPPCNTEYT